MPRRKAVGRQKKESIRSTYGYRGKTKHKVANIPGRKSVKNKPSVSRLRDMIRSVRWTDSYTSLLMGVVVVIVGVLFVVSFLKSTHHIQQTSSISTVAPSASSGQAPTTTSGQLPTGTPSQLKPSQKTYTVKSGDDLWHIAEKFYNSGYNWVDLAQANNLSDPSTIHAGNILKIPNVASKQATIVVTPTPVAQNTITSNSYTVQKGDDLWHIAVRAYGDGYQWVKIAQTNGLSNPSLIFSGNVLKLPR